MNRSITIEKPNRVYTIRAETLASGVEVFSVHFRPRNPKTGVPWQASHEITHLRADISLVGTEYGTDGEIRQGPVPQRWWDANPEYKFWVNRISSEAAARVLAEDHFSNNI